MSLVTLIMPAPAGKRGGREAAFNILKGICIIEVMLHHLLSFSAREFAVKGAPEWWAFLVTNRLLHFAVPVFLMVSAVLLTRSLTAEARPNWKRFYLRRAQQTLWPYLLWSLLYLLFRAYVISRPGDIRPLLVALPFVETPIPLPALLVSGDQWERNLVWGKGYFHLYFLVILLQFALLFPALFYALRGLRLRFGGVVLLGAVLQVGVYVAQARYVRLPYPATCVLWYLLPLLIGIWIGLNPERWEATWRAWRWPVALATLAALSVYLFLSLFRLQTGERVPSLPYNAGASVYATGVALLLLSLSRRLAVAAAAAAANGAPARSARITRVLPAMLSRIGDHSLPLFLIHPAVLYLLGREPFQPFLDTLPLSPLWAGLILAGVTGGMAYLARYLWLDIVLFGRWLSPLPSFAPLVEAVREPSPTPAPEPSPDTPADEAPARGAGWGSSGTPMPRVKPV